MNNMKAIDDMIRVTSETIQAVTQAIRDEDPTLGMTLHEVRAAFTGMRDEDLFALTYQKRQAEEALTGFQFEIEKWFRKKGLLAARILELECEQKAEDPPTPTTSAEPGAPEAKA
jgi:hypothetical protein